jgi:hypothetical protein
MNIILKRIQIVGLGILFTFVGGNKTTNNLEQHNTNNKYVLSRYSHNRNFINSFRNASSAVNLPANTQESSNWSGYIVTPTSNNEYTNISGTWTIPNISASQSDAVASQWIGLGGVSSTDLLQMGTIEQVENGQPTAEVFWEKLPDVAQNVMSVPIGSTITVNISETSSTTWQLVFNATLQNGQTQTQTITANLDSSYDEGIGTSAEWISEDPSDENGQLLPLANMGIVNYEAATVNGQPLNAYGNDIEPVALMSNDGNILIYPSALGTDNESFSTTTNNSSTGSSSKRHRRRNKSPFGQNW